MAKGSEVAEFIPFLIPLISTITIDQPQHSIFIHSISDVTNIFLQVKNSGVQKV